MALETARGRRNARGFTLIEILVVIMIVSVMIGMIAINLQRDDRDVIRDFSGHLATLLQGAHDEAILRGSLIVFELKSGNYRFMQTSPDGKLVAITGGEFAQTELPEHLEANLEFENQESGKRKVIVFDPSGATPPYRISMALRKARWWIVGEPGGRVRTTPTLNEPAR